MQVRPRLARVSLLADTHLSDSVAALPGALVSLLQGSDQILHAGDLVALRVLRLLEHIGPVRAVRGNMDGPDVAAHLPQKLVIPVLGHLVGLIHGNRDKRIEGEYLTKADDYSSPALHSFYEYLSAEFSECDVIVFGHLHVPLVRRFGGKLLVNPGCSAPHVRNRSIGVLEVGLDSINARIVRY